MIYLRARGSNAQLVIYICENKVLNPKLKEFVAMVMTTMMMIIMMIVVVKCKL